MISAVIERCAGIDVGRKFVVVCVMVGAARETPEQEIRKFSTVNQDLEKLRQWLHEEQCTHVVMESTGSYWKPIYNILDDGELTVVLANSQQVKNLRGHKTDRQDSRWLAHLLRHADPAEFHTESGDSGTAGSDATAEAVDWVCH